MLPLSVQVINSKSIIPLICRRISNRYRQIFEFDWSWLWRVSSWTEYSWCKEARKRNDLKISQSSQNFLRKQTAALVTFITHRISFASLKILINLLPEQWKKCILDIHWKLIVNQQFMALKFYKKVKNDCLSVFQIQKGLRRNLVFWFKDLFELIT